jgi:serine/threonine protein kinase
MRARFTIIRELARGGAGSVYLAKDHDLNREVAIKELGEYFERERFFREAQITAQLEHPHIIPVYGLGYRSQGERPFLIMRFIRGRTLAQAINERYDQPGSGEMKSVEMHRLLQAFVCACRGVAYAHKRGVIHRDPKPANILLGESGEVVVVDWGLAKADGQVELPGQEIVVTQRAETDTQEGMIMGTPAYMAPEMAMGRNDLVDAQTDVYVLGACLFNLLTGKPPFTGSTGDVIQQIVTRASTDTHRPRSINPAVPAALDAICARAMARDKRDRYPSALNLAEDVENWLASQSPTTRSRLRLLRWISSLWRGRGSRDAPQSTNTRVPGT